MFEAEYARRRTTAEAEAGRICSGDTVYLAGGPLLPVDFAAALHRRAYSASNMGKHSFSCTEGGAARLPRPLKIDSDRRITRTSEAQRRPSR